jgi:chemotaxis protein MotA
MVKKSDHYKLIESMVDVCNVARKGGVLAIESKLKDIDNEFLRKGLEMTVDGKDEATVNAFKNPIKTVGKFSIKWEPLLLLLAWWEP